MDTSKVILNEARPKLTDHLVPVSNKRLVRT